MLEQSAVGSPPLVYGRLLRFERFFLICQSVGVFLKQFQIQCRIQFQCQLLHFSFRFQLAWSFDFSIFSFFISAFRFQSHLDGD